MVSDLIEMTGAFLLFPLVIVIPGYVIASYSSLFGGKSGTLNPGAGLLLSIAAGPGITYLLMRFGGFPAAWSFYGGAWILFGYKIFSGRTDFRRYLSYPLRHPGKTLLFMGLYLAGALLLVDFQVDGRLIRPLMSHDFVKHVAVTDAISRTAVPPANPSFHPGSPLPLFYYYFWFIFCSLIDLLGGPFIGPRGSVLASIVWCGIALVYLVRHFLTAYGRQIIKGFEPIHLVYAYILLLMTGMDILPITAEMLVRQESLNEPLFPDIMWWNDQVASWLSSVLWTPHHVGAFIGCMTAFYLTIEHANATNKTRYYAAIAIALSLASAPGMSIWVALVAAVFLIVWFVVSWSRGWYSEVRFLLLTGCLTLVLCLPYIIDLHQANHLHRTPVAIQVRTFYKLDYMLNGAHPAVIALTRLLALPLNYGLEFGFFALGGLIYWEYRRKVEEKLSRVELFLVVLMATSFFVCTFVRSAVVNNDLGWRGFMFAQFVLLLFSVPLLATLRNKFTDARLELAPATRYLAYTTLALSTGMLFLQMYVMRIHAWGPDGPLTASIREAYAWQDQNLPTDAVIQHNPDENIEYFHALYGNRQVSASDQLYGKLYGINDTMFDSTYDLLEQLFSPETTPEHGFAIATQLNIDGIFLKHSDPIWTNSTSWLSPYRPVYESGCCRIYTIGEIERQRTASAGF